MIWAAVGPIGRNLRMGTSVLLKLKVIMELTVEAELIEFWESIKKIKRKPVL